MPANGAAAHLEKQVKIWRRLSHTRKPSTFATRPNWSVFFSKPSRPPIGLTIFSSIGTKVSSNVEGLKIEIALLGSLAGSRNPEEALRNLLVRYPEVSRAIPILIAVRQLKFQVLENLETAEGYAEFDFSKSELSASEIEHVVSFCARTGITPMLASLKDLRGYVTGVEVGTDANARKNRSDSSTGRLVETFVNGLAGVHPNLEIRTQQKFSALEHIKGVAVPHSLRNRRFDMAITLDGRPFNIETNFYAGTGSKWASRNRRFVHQPSPGT